jgi:hypothetical protein
LLLVVGHVSLGLSPLESIRKEGLGRLSSGSLTPAILLRQSYSRNLTPEGVLPLFALSAKGRGF